MLINECVHNDDLGEIVGNFHGIPVRNWDAKATKTRDEADTIQRIADNAESLARRTENGEECFVYQVPDHEFVDKYGFIRPNHELPGKAVAAAA